MKLKIVAVVVTGLLAANVAHAAEVYNKDGNKLDLYGKVTALRYFTDDKRDDGDKTYARLGFKGETQINDQMIGFGHWEYDFKGYITQSSQDENNHFKRQPYCTFKRQKHYKTGIFKLKQ